MPRTHYEDDPTIPHDAELWRRVPPRQMYLYFDEGRWRPSTLVFDDDSDGSPMSAYLAGEVGDFQVVMVGHDGYGLVAITAGLARQYGQVIARVPEPGPGGSAHVHVCGDKPKRVKKAFAKQCYWVKMPPPEVLQSLSNQ